MQHTICIIKWFFGFRPLRFVTFTRYTQNFDEYNYKLLENSNQTKARFNYEVQICTMLPSHIFC